MTDYTKLVEALRFCARWHRADDALANAEQAADAIERLIAERDEAKTDLAAVGRAFIREIEQHEPKQGEWVVFNKQMLINLENAREQYKELGYPHRTELGLQCSNCRKVTYVDSGIKYEFCPHCGAKMEVQK